MTIQLNAIEIYLNQKILLFDFHKFFLFVTVIIRNYRITRSNIRIRNYIRNVITVISLIQTNQNHLTINAPRTPS